MTFVSVAPLPAVITKPAVNIIDDFHIDDDSNGDDAGAPLVVKPAALIEALHSLGVSLDTKECQVSVDMAPLFCYDSNTLPRV